MKRLIATIGMAVILSAPNLVLAQEVNGGVNGVQITPLTYNYEVKPGSTQQSKISVTNQADKEIDYITEVLDFSAVSKDGAPIFTNDALSDPVASFSKWVEFVSNDKGTLATGENKDIVFNINVPASAEPGGHYGAVFVKPTNFADAGANQLGISSRIGTLFLVSVDGQTTKTAQITNFSAPKVVWRGPISISSTVKNTGTVHFDSQVSVAVSPLLMPSNNLDLGKHTILPGSAREFMGSWGGKYPFGYYQFSLTATDGDGNNLSPVLASTLAIPLAIVMPVIIGILLILIFLKYLRKHLKVVIK